MSRKQSIDVFCDSQEVIRSYNEYVQKRGAFPARHKARVLIQSGRYNYNQVVYIGTRIETNYSFVSIFGDDEFCRDFHGDYRNDYQVFKSFQSGTIQISDTEDLWGNSVTIEISFVDVEA